MSKLGLILTIIGLFLIGCSGGGSETVSETDAKGTENASAPPPNSEKAGTGQEAGTRGQAGSTAPGAGRTGGPPPAVPGG